MHFSVAGKLLLHIRTYVCVYVTFWFINFSWLALLGRTSYIYYSFQDSTYIVIPICQGP